ncbi:MAG: FecR domain-containing protein [Verrucomicrobiota bacterium]
MKRNLSTASVLLIGLALTSLPVYAAPQPLKTAAYDRVYNDVSTYYVDGRRTDAKAKDTIGPDDVVQTGNKSRAQLRFQDDTIARLGSNTSFYFEPASRTMHLEKGTLLFHTPKGQGGGYIRTQSITAGITGTTVTVSTTSNGGFKLLVLEGTCRVTLPNGDLLTLLAGEMTFVFPGQTGKPPVLKFDLERNIEGAQLVQGFDIPLSSMPLIQTEIEQQQEDLENGKAKKTNILIGDATDNESFDIHETIEISIDPETAFEGVGSAQLSNLNSDNITISLGQIDGSFILESIDPDLRILGPGNLSISNATIENRGGDLFIGTEGDLTLTTTDLIALNQIDLTSNQALTLTNVELITTSSKINLKSANSLTINNLLLSSSNQVSTLNFDGGDLLSFVNDSSQLLNALSSSLSADTIVLKNVNFPVGAQAKFYTRTGNWRWDSVDFATIPGQLNLINVNKNGGTTPLFNSTPPGVGGPGNIDGDPNFQSLVR